MPCALVLTLPPRPMPEEADLRSGVLCPLDTLSSGFPLGLSKGNGQAGGLMNPPVGRESCVIVPRGTAPRKRTYPMATSSPGSGNSFLPVPLQGRLPSVTSLRFLQWLSLVPNNHSYLLTILIPLSPSGVGQRFPAWSSTGMIIFHITSYPNGPL